MQLQGWSGAQHLKFVTTSRSFVMGLPVWQGHRNLGLVDTSRSIDELVGLESKHELTLL